MKILFFAIVLTLYGSFDVFGQYSSNKMKYDISDYSYHQSDPYNPLACGIASYFLPGLGQILADETKRGLIFTSAFAGSFSLAAVGLFDIELNQNDARGPTLLIAGLTGAIVTWTWSIVDAVKVAKINNLAYRDKTTFLNKIELKPFITSNNKSRYVGASLQIKL